MNDRYFINHKEYSKDELIAFAENHLKQGSLDDWESDLYEFILQWFSPTEFISIYTSGSTGTPKEIRMSKDQMGRSALRTLEYFNISQHQNILLCLPVKYIAGMMIVVRAFTGVANLITLPPQKLLLKDDGTTLHFAALVPLQMEKLLNEQQPIGHIKKIILGGAPVSASLEERLKSFYPGQAWETYGMTETITHVAVRQLGEANRLFHALPGISFTVDSRHCLVISDPLIRVEPFITNDHVELISETSFRLLGRIDRVINSGGIKIQPEEVERQLAPYITRKFCVISVPNHVYGEVAVLVIEKGDPFNDIEKALSSLNPYHRPKQTIELDSIPLNANGKIDYGILKEMINDTLEA